MKKFLWLTIFALVFGKTSIASAILYDLTNDWSNIINPNGVWSLNEGNNPLPFVQDWLPFGNTGIAGDQNAWAAAPFSTTGHVPVWAKADAGWSSWTGTSDLVAGDVVAHGKCCSNLPSAGFANVTWTSDVSGAATISGGVWFASTAQRNVDWTVYINGASITGGNVGFGDIYDRANPFTFSSGSGGAGVLSFDTVAGDVVKLELKKGSTSQFDHFVGVDFSIEVVPEPNTLALTAFCLLGLLGCGRRRKRQRAGCPRYEGSS